jgi:hypothetical protein
MAESRTAQGHMYEKLDVRMAEKADGSNVVEPHG